MRDAKSIPPWLFVLTVATSLCIGMGLFVALPHLLSESTLGHYTRHRLALSGFEGFIKSCLFVTYIWLIGRKRDIRRLFEYHGAEHKVVFAAERNHPLTPEGSRDFSRLHPRCGTNFAVVTIVVSILVFSLLPQSDYKIVGIGWRFLFMPLVAGLSYEVIKLTVHPVLGRAAITLMTPGLWLQRLTTQQPDDAQLEVSCAAMKAVLDAENQVSHEATKDNEGAETV
ncbi:MAG TPA: DUF1385 domain-containing protein [Abditibacteriaceae bacterium]|jgi:uncharacterized protein YqhQ